MTSRLGTGKWLTLFYSVSTICNCDGNEFVTPMAKSSEPCVAIFAMANFEAQKPANAKLDISRVLLTQYAEGEQMRYACANYICETSYEPVLNLTKLYEEVQNLHLATLVFSN